MKIKIIDIIALCNLTHPDFGTFARHLGGLADEDGCIDIPAAKDEISINKPNP